MFRKVYMTDQPEIAKVNRKTGTLYLDSKIWDKLPTDQKDFVLFHEAGHLRLQTNDEFKANAYAVNKFSPAGTFSNKELGKKIMVMREIYTTAQTNNFTADLAAGAVTGIFQNLSILGIGSKSRIKETNAAAAANSQILGAQATLEAEKSKARTKTIVLVGVFLLILIVSFLTLRKK